MRIGPYRHVRGSRVGHPSNNQSSISSTATGRPRKALATVGLDPVTVVPVLGGWANFTFELDGVSMVRFPSSPGVAESTRRELRLLPALAPFVDFEIPEPALMGEWNGWPFFTYGKLDGRPLRSDDDSAG